MNIYIIRLLLCHIYIQPEQVHGEICNSMYTSVCVCVHVCMWIYAYKYELISGCCVQIIYSWELIMRCLMIPMLLKIKLVMAAVILVSFSTLSFSFPLSLFFFFFLFFLNFFSPLASFYSSFILLTTTLD